MSFSNRTYVCPLCGAIKRAPIPDGVIGPATYRHQPERALVLPIPYGHWRSLRAYEGFVLPKQYFHCGVAMFILGKRAEQAATQITPKERIEWLKLNARVAEHAGKKRWRAILSEAKLKEAYPLI